MDSPNSSCTPFPNIPPIIENDDREYQDSGVPSTIAIAGHPLHPLSIIFPIAFLAAELSYRHKIGVVGAGSKKYP